MAAGLDDAGDAASATGQQIDADRLIGVVGDRQAAGHLADGEASGEVAVIAVVHGKHALCRGVGNRRDRVCGAHRHTAEEGAAERGHRDRENASAPRDSVLRGARHQGVGVEERGRLFGDLAMAVSLGAAVTSTAAASPDIAYPYRFMPHILTGSVRRSPAP